MTTATKPLPPHGSYARANGAPGYREPCKCETCHKASRRARKQYNVNRQLGRPALVDATPAREHLKALARTMTWGQIAEDSGFGARTLQFIAEGRRTQIRRSTCEQILTVTPRNSAPGKYLDATGFRRRLQALRAIGYSAARLAQAANTAEARIQLVCNGGQPTVRYTLAEKILKVYSDLSQTPAPAGRSATRTMRHAAANSWAPPAAWDDDAIDNPQAVPDWTGECGTDRGYWVHRRQNLPMCDRCQTAHDDWLAQHADLPGQERARKLFAARAAASSHEADVAHDARELMRVSGLDSQQAADRLGVTRQHLQQALLRHPEQVAA